jgi:RsiW-degrading membrane proteinase PrsW (M82 family)
VDLTFPGTGFIAFLLWAVLEESFKFMAAFAGGLHSKENNEPVDGLVYMITAALGFTALENILFLLNPLLLPQADIAGGVITGSIRFIGASLLHTISSGVIGIALAFSLYKSRRRQIANVLAAFVIAVAIHTAFNLFVMHESSLSTPMAFAGVWTGVAILLLFFERIKALRRERINI